MDVWCWFGFHEDESLGIVQFWTARNNLPTDRKVYRCKDCGRICIP
jgi:hypothetical protein